MSDISQMPEKIVILQCNLLISCVLPYSVEILTYIPNLVQRPSWPWSHTHGSWINNYLCNRYLSPLMLWIRHPPRARCTTLLDKVCDWLVAGPLVSSTNKTDRHEKTEILLKVALSTIKPTNQLIQCTRRISGITFIG